LFKSYLTTTQNVRHCGKWSLAECTQRVNWKLPTEEIARTWKDIESWLDAKGN